jgi:hypothetical protein
MYYGHGDPNNDRQSLRRLPKAPLSLQVEVGEQDLDPQFLFFLVARRHRHVNLGFLAHLIHRHSRDSLAGVV